MANEDLSQACGAPVTETETQFLLRLIRDAQAMGLAELRYRDLFVRFRAPEPRAEGALRMNGVASGFAAPLPRNANASIPGAFQIPDMSK